MDLPPNILNALLCIELYRDYIFLHRDLGIIETYSKRSIPWTNGLVRSVISQPKQTNAIQIASKKLHIHPLTEELVSTPLSNTDCSEYVWTRICTVNELVRGVIKTDVPISFTVQCRQHMPNHEVDIMSIEPPVYPYFRSLIERTIECLEHSPTTRPNEQMILTRMDIASPFIVGFIPHPSTISS